MKLTSLLQKLLFVPVLLGLTVVLATGCSDDDDELQGEEMDMFSLNCIKKLLMVRVLRVQAIRNWSICMTPKR